VLQDNEGGEHAIGRSIAAVEADLHFEVEQRAADPLSELGRSVTRYEDRAGDGTELKGVASLGPGVPEVLIAEDNPDMRSLLLMLLGREFRVRAARNGREALELVRESQPDLVLSDVMMPEMSGLELCAAIKQTAETRSIPVVLVTSKAEGEMKIEGLELGADDYVTKPFHPRELMARVRSLIRVVVLQKQLAVRNHELEEALTELKQAEVQLVRSERLAAVGELAAGIAHEVNNPVNFALNAVRAMRGTVNELRSVADAVCHFDGSDGERLVEQVESFQQAQEQGGAAEMADTLLELAEIVGEGLTRTHALVGDLRDFAMPGRVSEMSAGVDVEKGLRSTIQLLKHTLSSNDAAIELDIAPGVPRIVGDGSGLNQVYLNLIKNAAESFGHCGGRIEVSLVRDEEDVVLSITDDGPGISGAHLNRLFEPFFTTKPEGQGTGLGLSISQQIVASHGGALTVESEPAEGARFTIRLPIAGPPAEEPEAHDPGGAAVAEFRDPVGA
jgi:two-component system NtrC family sensor kinase